MNPVIDLKFPEIERVEEGRDHYYLLNGNMIPGVTTILDHLAKENLIPWAANKAVEYLTGIDPTKKIKVSEPRWKPGKSYTNNEIAKLTDEARKNFRAISGGAKGIGSTVHAWVEGHCAGKKQPDPQDESAAKCVKAFLEWESRVKPEWLMSEIVVASDHHRYAGTFDFLARVDGRLVLGDFKTSAYIRDEYWLQLAAYQNAIDEWNKGVEFERMVVILPKTGGDVVATKDPGDYKAHRDAFLALRRVHTWLNYMKAINGGKP